jgi:hypothetical protein
MVLHHSVLVTIPSAMKSRRRALILVVSAMLLGTRSEAGQGRNAGNVQRVLRDAIVQAAQAQGAQMSDEAIAALAKWTSAGAKQLAGQESKELDRARVNAARVGQLIGDEAKRSGNGTATRAIVGSVFGRVCPLYPFC